MIDRTTKIVLAFIALGLWLNAISPMLHPKKVSAEGRLDCKGTVKVNVYGATEAQIGGYDVDLKCDQ